jgi:hypothetical protein
MRDEIYRSANGDRWLLIREQSVVRHEPNLASGGRVTESSSRRIFEADRVKP